MQMLSSALSVESQSSRLEMAEEILGQQPYCLLCGPVLVRSITANSVRESA